jgi:hypothetical protein
MVGSSSAWRGVHASSVIAGGYLQTGVGGGYWSSTNYSVSNNNAYYLNYGGGAINSAANTTMVNGLTVRCVSNI